MSPSRGVISMEMNNSNRKKDDPPGHDVTDQASPLQEDFETTTQYPGQLSPLLANNEPARQHRITRRPLAASFGGSPKHGNKIATENLQTHNPEEDTNRRRTIHWLSPTSMTFNLVAVVCLAVGHHCYYHLLDGQAVGSSDDQQWSLRYAWLEII